jgi:methylglyoxal/glyoxal reductase
MDTLTIKSTVTLNNSVAMPVIGLGTFQSETGEQTRSAVIWALEAGYRHIDTAAIYRNERDVGQAIRESGIRREDIFITTKLWNAFQGYDRALSAYEESLERLGVDYIDLFLIHWPQRAASLDTWRALVRLYEQKRVRAVGVSNYTVSFLEDLCAGQPLIPAVNQFEISPFNTRAALVRYCQEKGIQVESYSPLVRGQKFSHPTITTIAEETGKTPAQVLIRWGLEKGFVVIPKSVRRERIIENANVFDFSLSLDQMHSLDSLNENLHTINPPWMAGEWDS